MAANIDLDKISGQIESVLSTDISEGEKSKILRLKEWFKAKRSEVKPWGDFFNTRKFIRPANASEASSRLISNVRLYQANYLIICILMTLYCIITSPLLLIGITMSIGGCAYISTRGQGKTIRIFGKEFSTMQQYGLVFLICTPLFFLASAGSTVFWIIGASLVIICAHAIMLAAAQNTAEFEMESVETQ